MSVRTILVVDDDPQIVGYVERVLQNAQYQTLTASDGTGALEILEKESVDCIVTDLVMPKGLGGVELFIHLRQLKPDLPIVVMSGQLSLSSEAFERLAGQFGVKEVLNKPFDPDQLVAAVAAALGSGKA